MKRTRLPLGILGFIIAFIVIKMLFNAQNSLDIRDDGTVYYKKSAVGDDYLYRINDTIAFQAHLLPTMGAISTTIVSYHPVGAIEGIFMGKYKPGKEIFYPSEMKGDWIYTSYAKPGDYFALNIKTGELLKNETTSDELYKTEFYQAKFGGGDSFHDEKELLKYESISTYKESGSALMWAGLLLMPVMLVWILIAFILDKRKPKVVAAQPQQPTGGRAPAAN